MPSCPALREDPGIPCLQQLASILFRHPEVILGCARPLWLQLIARATLDAIYPPPIRLRVNFLVTLRIMTCVPFALQG